METVPWASDFKAAVDQFGDLPCVTDAETTLSFNQVASRAGALAHLLRARNLAPGSPVAVSLRNGRAALWAGVGMRLSGVAEAPLNDGLGEAERRYCLSLSGACLVVTTRAQAPGFAALGCEVLAIEDVPDGPADLHLLPPAPAAAHSRISFTSGTTGQPKAIVQSHAARWIGTVIQQASHSTAPGPGNSVLLMTPFVHGASLLSYAFMLRGARSVILDGVQIELVEKFLEQAEIDHIFAPPTVMAKITTAFDGRQFAGIRMIFCGTAPLLPPLYARARNMFGPVVRVTYGKTEITNPITALSPAQLDAYYTNEADGDGICVGFPGTGVEVQLRDEAGAICGSGEIFLRGRHMAEGHIDSSGYHPLPEDGFHATGDLGRIDAQGRLHLVGRMADVVKSGGYKIHPDEIERALAASAGGRATSIVSLPSEYWGEIIVAVAEDADAGWPEAARAAVASLARYKHPRAYIVLPSLPRNAQGKIMRRLIRAEILDRFSVVDGPYPTLQVKT